MPLVARSRLGCELTMNRTNQSKAVPSVPGLAVTGHDYWADTGTVTLVNVSLVWIPGIEVRSEQGLGCPSACLRFPKDRLVAMPVMIGPGTDNLPTGVQPTLYRWRCGAAIERG